jgi:hypothetical protein
MHCAEEYRQRSTMAKGQQRKPKEKKKPKAEGKAHAPSAYAQAYKGKSGGAPSTFMPQPKKEGT